MVKLDKIVYVWPTDKYAGLKSYVLDLNDCDGYKLRVEIRTEGKLEEIVEATETAIELARDAVKKIEEKAAKAEAFAEKTCIEVSLTELEKVINEALKKANINASVELNWYKEDPEDDP